MTAADLRDRSGPVDLQPFETDRQSILAAPIPVAAGMHVVLELFDKPGGFTAATTANWSTRSADFSSELLRQAAVRAADAAGVD